MQYIYAHEYNLLPCVIKSHLVYLVSVHISWGVMYILHGYLKSKAPSNKAVGLNIDTVSGGS